MNGPGTASLPPGARSALLLALVLAALGLAAFANGLATPFVYDDEPAIVDNPRIRSLWPFGEAHEYAAEQSTDNGRPVVQLSLAANYALGGLDPRGYHAFNLAVHVLSAFVLALVVRRTLAVVPALARDAALLAACSAALWLVHPLQVDAVTYVIQRTELLMGLFLLVTLYAAIRARDGGTGWKVTSVVACALGMASKEAMFAAPLLVALHDRAFAYPDWRSAWRARRKLWLALAATWIVLVLLVRSGPRDRTVGFDLGVAWWEYGRAQLGTIGRYLRLAFWPDALCLDYGRPRAVPRAEIVAGACVVIPLGLATLWALVRRPRWGFAGAFFFFVLAPSSSFVPIVNEVGAERRMHVPLAAVVVLVVLALHALAVRVARSERAARIAVACATLVLVVALGARTVARNRDFADPLVLWQDTVAKRPYNPAARNNLGRALAQRGEIEGAFEQFQVAIGLPECGVDAFDNYGKALSDLGRHAESEAYFRDLLRTNPAHCAGHEGLAAALMGQRRWAEAVQEYEQALACGRRSAGLYSNMGKALFGAGRIQDSIAAFERALALDPTLAVAAQNLAEVRKFVGVPPPPR